MTEEDREIQTLREEGVNKACRDKAPRWAIAGSLDSFLHDVECGMDRSLGGLGLLNVGVGGGQDRAVLLPSRDLARDARLLVGAHCVGDAMRWVRGRGEARKRERIGG